MTTRTRATFLIGMAAALIVGSSGCDPYTYYNVHVTLQLDGNNPVKIPNTLNQIASCDLSVYASDYQSGPIERGVILNQRTLGPKASPCRGNLTPTDFGILDYSTARSSGSLSFRVNVHGSGTDPITGQAPIIIQGTTDPVPVSPGHVLPTLELVLSPCGPSGNPDQPNQSECK